MTKTKPTKILNLLDVVKQCVEDGRYLETVHAKQRQALRGIILPHILHVLKNGIHEKKKDTFDEVYQAWNYAIRGCTADNVEMRVIISFDDVEQLLIITAFHIEAKGIL